MQNYYSVLATPVVHLHKVWKDVKAQAKIESSDPTGYTWIYQRWCLNKYKIVVDGISIRLSCAGPLEILKWI